MPVVGRLVSRTGGDVGLPVIGLRVGVFVGGWRKKLDKYELDIEEYKKVCLFKISKTHQSRLLCWRFRSRLLC